MIKSNINIYGKTDKKEGKPRKVQYVIRLKSSEIASEILEQFNDKDIVIVLTENEYNDLVNEKKYLENEVQRLDNECKNTINELSIKHIEKVNKLTKKNESLNEQLETERSNINRISNDKRLLEVSLNKAQMKINELENTFWNKFLSRFRKKKELKEGKKD